MTLYIMFIINNKLYEGILVTLLPDILAKVDGFLWSAEDVKPLITSFSSLLKHWPFFLQLPSKHPIGHVIRVGHKNLELIQVLSGHLSYALLEYILLVDCSKNQRKFYAKNLIIKETCSFITGKYEIGNIK